MRSILSCFLLVMLLVSSSSARRLKAFSYPKEIAAGQMAMIVMENPNFDKVYSRTKCDAEKLIAWVKDEVPILRIEQKGKSIFTSLGSFQQSGDSAIASFMVPVTLEAGPASLFIVNDHDASVPYNFTVVPKMSCKLVKVAGGSIKPLQQFTVVVEGTVGLQMLDTKVPIHALEGNIGYSKLPAADQYAALNKRMSIDWAQIPTADFLAVDQGSKHWDIFVEGCGISKDGLTLDFICPPDLTPGQATLTLSDRYNGTEACKSTPLPVTVQ
jgi:hypothetical protein